MTIIGTVPQDEALMEAERQAKSPYDFAPDGAGVAAIREIADRIAALNVPPGRGGDEAGAAARP